jgi:hypothetical protein
MYKGPLKALLSRDDIDMMKSEYGFKVKSRYFFHQGECDFIIETPDYFDLIDGKKSSSSFLDNDQLFHYKLMGELVLQKPCRDLSWFIWDENKLDPIKDHKGSSEDLLNRMKNTWDEFQKYIDPASPLSPDRYPIRPSYGSCMFCMINDNCLGTNSSKEELTEI